MKLAKTMLQNAQISYGPQVKLLDEDMGPWVSRYADRAQRQPEEYGDLSTLLNDFYRFAMDYFKYFEVLLEGPSGTSSLANPDAIRQKALQNIVDEWGEISRVVEQRDVVRYEKWLLALQKESRGFLPAGAPGMVTYLGRSETLRHLPYSRVSVASISRDQFENETEAKMALAHEAGHHMWRLSVAEKLRATSSYWQGIDTVRKQIQSTTANADARSPLRLLIDSWLQEMFADVYGTVKARKEFADSAMKALARRTQKPADLLHNDGQHPVPYLRPLLRIYVLQKTAESTHEANDADALCDEWQRFLAGNGLADPAQTITISIPSEEQRQPLQVGDKGLITGAVGDGHWHYWQDVELNLATVRQAAELAIDRALLPLAQEAAEGKIEYARFDWEWVLRDYLERLKRVMVNLQNPDEALEVLKHAISFLVGDYAEGTGGGGGESGKPHSHCEGCIAHRH